MIITQFRKYTPTNMVLLVLLGVVLCLLKQFTNLPVSDPQTAGYGLYLSYALIVVQAFYLNRVMNKHNFFGKPGFLLALLYLSLASFGGALYVLTPVLICNFIFIRMIDKLIGIYHRETAILTLFDLGMLVGLGSLIYYPFSLMLVSVWVGLRLFRSFYWREWLAPFLGLLTVIFLAWVYFFWVDQTDRFMALWPADIRFSLDFITFGTREYLLWASVFVLLILFLNVLRENIFKRVVQIRKIVQLLLIMLIISLLAYLLDHQPDSSPFLLAVPPLAIYAAYYFHYASTKWFYETIYMLSLLTLLISYFL